MLADLLLCRPPFAPNRAWLGRASVSIAINWAAFYTVVDWLKKAPEGGHDLALRARIQFGGSALWAVAIAQTSWVAAGAGPISELLLILLRRRGGGADLLQRAEPSGVARDRAGRGGGSGDRPAQPAARRIIRASWPCPEKPSRSRSA